MLWMETATPEIKDAKLLSELLSEELKNNKFLCYNLSPSFNWSKFGFNNKNLQSFCSDLAKYGYTWQVKALPNIFFLVHYVSRFSFECIKKRKIFNVIGRKTNAGLCIKYSKKGREVLSGSIDSLKMVRG